MSNPTDINRILTALRLGGVCSARDLAASLGKSQPTISRLLSTAGSKVARWGVARHTRYAATREVRGLGTHWKLYEIDARGMAHTFGELTALHGDACLVKTSATPDWFRDEFATGYFPGIPWFLDDMRPQGFLGRQFAHQIADDLGLPSDIHTWNADAILTALLLRGADTSGHFVLGSHALHKALQPEKAVTGLAERSTAYAKLADTAMANQFFGSSVAGEQPKFTTCVAERSGTVRHVLVKFSGKTAGNSVAQRWADLLVAEHTAAQVLSDNGHVSARTELIEADGRLCLETTRFDRVGPLGRHGIVTLAAWSDAHDGVRDNWAAAAERMRERAWISTDVAQEIGFRWWFGRLIGNTDMHFGNLTFYLDTQLPLRLAPSYDMLPMCYAPGANGTLCTQALIPPTPLPDERGTWIAASQLAQSYWARLAKTDLLTSPFRHAATENAKRLAVAHKIP